MQHFKSAILANLFILLLITSLKAQATGGPYTSDANTILLMHFDGNLNEEASNLSVNNQGIAKSYITSPISGLGDAIYFDNTISANNSYITVPYSSVLSMSNNWTIEFWFKINSWNQNHNKWPVPILLPTTGWDANYYLEIPAEWGRLKYGFSSSDGGVQILSSPNSITTGVWYHVALINDYDNNTIKLILHDSDFNKLEEQSSSYSTGTTISTGTQDLKIGNGNAGDNRFDGYIDELRISNVVRDYSVQYNWQTTSSDNFIFHYTKPELINQNLINTLEKKFDNLDNIIWADWRDIYLLDRSQKINVFLYDTDEPLLNASAEVRDWDVGYYTGDEIHIKVPSTVRQLKYFPTFEKAAISVLARYVMAKKRTSTPSNGMSFGFGLYESGYSPDLNLIENYLSANSNTFPNSATFSTWEQLDDETNVELAYTFTFASIIRGGYFSATVWNGLYDSRKDEWYQIFRIFFLEDLIDGGMQKFYEGDDYIIYSNSQEVADLSLEALQWYADQYDEEYGVRINHPMLVTIYGSDETYSYTKEGNINNVGGGGEALSHSVLRTSPATENIDTEQNRVFTKYSGIIGHEFMHNVFAFATESTPPSWLNEGSAMYGAVDYLQGYKGINVNNMEGKHNYFWNTNGMYFPDLDKIFEMDGDFGYRMATSAFTFIKNNFPKETLLQFMKRSDDFSIIGYSDITEFQRHLYESLYHQYLPSFLFNPNWSLDRTYTQGNNYLFNWDGHYINDLVIEYSTDETDSWNLIAEVSLSNGSYSWIIPNAENCILRFSDKKFPDINFTFQILGEKPTFGKVFNMTFEDGAINNISSGNNGSGKDYVQYELRDGENGNYAKFNGLWNAITVQNYPNLNLSEDWTIQGDFLIENTTGVINTKPVLLEKISAGYWAKNYSISFNNNGLNKLRFEYRLENNQVVKLDVDAGITENTWYTFYFARSVNNNIVEARVYDQNRNLLGNVVRQINGEGKVLTGAGDLYLGSSDFYSIEEKKWCLQGGLDNIIIADTYYDKLMSNSINNAPIVSDIPNQTINTGENFTTIQLDDFVTDADNSDNEIIWIYSGNSNLSVVIDGNRVATITTPSSDWIGSETITFTATDPEGDSGSDDVLFTVLNSSSQQGTLSNNIQITSSSLGYSCQYRVYTPAGYNTLTSLPTIYVTDGQNYIDNSKGKMITTLDELISNKIIEPVIAVFLDPRDPNNLSNDRRGSEYRNNINFVNYVTQELIPVIDATYKTNTSADTRGIMGASYGGYNAAYFCAKASDYFNFFGMNSAYLHPNGDYNIDNDLLSTNLDGMKLYLSYGSADADGERYFNRLKSVFDQKGKEFEYDIVNDGHTWTNWRSVVDDALNYFFPNSANPPFVNDIPNQTIFEGNIFTTIQLDDFVTDSDNDDSEITWSFNGNDELSIEVDGSRVATIAIPNENWFGREIITFTATDPSNSSSSRDVTFLVLPVNDYPIITDAPELIEFVSDTTFTLDIWELTSDVETTDDSLLYEFSVDSDSILFSYDDGSGILTLSAEKEFGGAGDLSWSVSDTEAIAVDTIHISVEKAVVISVNDRLIIPDEYVLHQNYPNPFNPSTMVKYGIPEQSNIRIEVFNMLGQSVGLLVNENKSAGYYETTWNAENLPSGLYLISLRAEGINSKKNFVQVKKALLLK